MWTVKTKLVFLQKRTRKTTIATTTKRTLKNKLKQSSAFSSTIMNQVTRQHRFTGYMRKDGTTQSEIITILYITKMLSWQEVASSRWSEEPLLIVLGFGREYEVSGKNVMLKINIALTSPATKWSHVNMSWSSNRQEEVMHCLILKYVTFKWKNAFSWIDLRAMIMPRWFKSCDFNNALLRVSDSRDDNYTIRWKN